MSRQFYNWIRKLKSYPCEKAINQGWLNPMDSAFSRLMCQYMTQDWMAGNKDPIYKLKKLIEVADIDGYIQDTSFKILKDFAQLLDADSKIDEERQLDGSPVPVFFSKKYNGTLSHVKEIAISISSDSQIKVANEVYRIFKCTMLDIDSKELFAIAAKEFYDIAQNQILLKSIYSYNDEELIDKVISHLYIYSFISTIGYYKSAYLSLFATLKKAKSNSPEESFLYHEVGKENVQYVREIIYFLFDNKHVNDIGTRSIINELPSYVAEDSKNDKEKEEILEKEIDICHAEEITCKDIVITETANLKVNFLDEFYNILDDFCDTLITNNEKTIIKEILLCNIHADYAEEGPNMIDSRLQDLLDEVVGMHKKKKEILNNHKEKAIGYYGENPTKNNKTIVNLLIKRLKETISLNKPLYFAETNKLNLDLVREYYFGDVIKPTYNPKQSFYITYYDGAFAILFYFLKYISNRLIEMLRLGYQKAS